MSKVRAGPTKRSGCSRPRILTLRRQINDAFAGPVLAVPVFMFRSLNIAATGMAAQETKLDTISNNLANVSTTGYKRQNAEFEDLLYQNIRSATPNAQGGTAPAGTQVGTGVRVVSTSRSFSLRSGCPHTSANESYIWFGFAA